MKDSGRVAAHIKELPKSGIRDFFELVNTMDMDGVISLGVGEPDFTTPQHIRKSAIHALKNGNTSYTSNLGMMSLRREICKYVSNEYNVQYDPEDQCIITVGVSEALDLAIRALVNPGDEVIYCEPCYVSYNPEIRMAFGKPVAIETSVENNFAPTAAQIAARITGKSKVLLLNSPCNPTGATIELEELKKIALIAIKHDLVVITDEIYSELSYGPRIPSIASLPGMSERTLFLHGFSKAFAMTGFRIAYACGPADIIAAMMKIHQYSMLCAPTNAQDAAIEALRNGKGEMEKMRDEYCRRRNKIVERFNQIGLDCFMPKGAFYVFPSIKKTNLSSRDFALKLLDAQKVAVVPGTAFGSCGEGFVRCCYAASMDDIIEAARRIELFVKSL